MCCMIAENEFVLDRHRAFKNSKYIIVARLEKADTSAGTWEGQVNRLKGAFQVMMNENKRETRLLIDNMREEMISNYRGLD